jgi:hypothetical protein
MGRWVCQSKNRIVKIIFLANHSNEMGVLGEMSNAEKYCKMP